MLYDDDISAEGGTTEGGTTEGGTTEGGTTEGGTTEGGTTEGGTTEGGTTEGGTTEGGTTEGGTTEGGTTEGGTTEGGTTEGGTTEGGTTEGGTTEGGTTEGGNDNQGSDNGSENKPGGTDEDKGPVQNATFTNDGITIEAQTTTDLTGLSVVITEVSDPKNNFGLPSNFEAIGYDIHFADKDKVEVKCDGTFIVRLPIPTEFVGKTVRIFHKEDADSEATELKYTIVDGKYVFETDSFSWFIVAYDKNAEAVETPSQSEEVKAPQLVNDNAGQTSDAGNASADRVVVEVLEQTTVRRSPETGVGTHSFGSVFAELISLLGLSVLGKKRAKNEF